MMRELNEAYAILFKPVRRKEYDLPLGYHAVSAKLLAGVKVKINAHFSSSPYRDHIGVIDKRPVKDTFRFWYIIHRESKDFSTINRFAEENSPKLIKRQISPCLKSRRLKENSDASLTI